MRRRTLLLAAASAAGAAGAGSLAACTTGTAARTTPAAGVTASPVPILGSTTSSTLGPQPITAPYSPVPGTAPARAYALGTRTFGFSRDGRPLPTTVWYPAPGTAPATPAPVDGATPMAGRFPLVLFSHGLTSRPADYAAMLMRWAQAGFVVAGPTYPNTSFTADQAGRLDSDDIVNQPADASHVIDLMLAQAGTVTATIDAGRIAAGGHSAGGITTAGLFSAHRDERLKAGLIFAGTDFRATPFAGPAAAMLFVHGRDDGTVTWRAGHTVFQAVPWSRAMLSITEGGHVTESADFEATTQTSTEFLRYALYGDAAAKARLPGAAAAGDVATFENEL